ncbi:MAG: hypothetical protein ACPGU1_15500 [Myxococcota bacterium]
MTALTAVIRGLPRDELVLRMSAVMLMIDGAQAEALLGLLTVLGGLGVVFPRVLRRPAFWWTAVGLTVVFHGAKWFWIYNHKILFTYWTIACALAVSRPMTIHILAKSARLLIGLTFLAAFSWKLFGGHFLDGSYMHYLMLCNQKFVPWTHWLTGVSMETLGACDAALRALDSGILAQDVTPLPTDDAIVNVSLFASYYTLAVEGGIAIVFLLGERVRAWWRHAFLWLFILSVYPIATVPAFALIVLTMSLADIEEGHTRLRIGALIMMALSVLSFVPRNVPRYLSLIGDFFTW